VITDSDLSLPGELAKCREAMEQFITSEIPVNSKCPRTHARSTGEFVSGYLANRIAIITRENRELKGERDTLNLGIIDVAAYMKIPPKLEPSVPWNVAVKIFYDRLDARRKAIVLAVQAVLDGFETTGQMNAPCEVPPRLMEALAAAVSNEPEVLHPKGSTLAE